MATASANSSGRLRRNIARSRTVKPASNSTTRVAVDPAGTTKECAACGVETDKPLWVREHSCPSCGFTKIAL
ncbi:zinc ribbon domain-containing protein [Natrialba taiwanensis]|uniref:zinc ribbon domain-containing protein n=1 Tax=Natrialba taiwanensis TaxID=160846 RepID=UPI00373AE331